MPEKNIMDKHPKSSGISSQRARTSERFWKVHLKAGGFKNCNSKSIFGHLLMRV